MAKRSGIIKRNKITVSQELLAYQSLSAEIFFHPVPSIDVNGIQSPWEPEESICFATLTDLYQFRGCMENMPDFNVDKKFRRDFEYPSFGLKTSDTTLSDEFMLRLRFEYSMQGGRRQPRDAAICVKDSGKSIFRREFETDTKKRIDLGTAWEKLKASYPATFPARLQKVSSYDLSVQSVTAVKRAGFNAIHHMPDYDAAIIYHLSQDVCATTPPEILSATENNLNIVGTRYEGEWEIVGLYSHDRDLETETLREIIEASLKITRGHIYSYGMSGISDCDESKVEYANRAVAETQQDTSEVTRKFEPKDYRKARLDLSSIFPDHANPVKNMSGALKALFATLPSPHVIHANSQHAHHSFSIA